MNIQQSAECLVEGMVLSLSGDFADLANARLMNIEHSIPPNPYNGNAVVAYYNSSGHVETRILKEASISKCLSALEEAVGVSLDDQEPFAVAVQCPAGQRFRSNDTALHDAAIKRLASLC